MPIQINPITSHEINLIPPNSKTPAFGWIRLVNGVQDAGYINLIPPNQAAADPSLEQLPNIPPYIVVDMSISDLGVVLDILRNEGKLQIRYDDTGAPPPFAIIEPTNPAGTPVAGNPPKSAQALMRRLDME
jgi:hypothetical protein